VWKNIRTHCGVGGEDDDGNNLWDQDCARHTVASAIHRLQMSEKSYWTDVFGHTPEMFKKAYRNPELDKDQANEYLQEIQPPNVVDQKVAAQTFTNDLIKARDEAKAKNPEFENGDEYNAGLDFAVDGISGVEMHHITEEFPDWFKKKYPQEFKDMVPDWF
jgi:hypothetical protein